MPRVPLTDTAIRNLNLPATGTSTTWDSLAGFGIRCSAGGTKAFIVLVGSGRRKTIGHYPIITLSDARTEAKRIFAEITLGTHQQNRTTFGATLSLFYETYSKQRHRPRTAAENKRVLEKHFKPLHQKTFENIHAHDIHTILDNLKDTPSEAEHTFRVARTFFNFALKRRLLKENPCAGIDEPPKGKPRERVLSDEELAKVWHRAAEIGYPYGTIVQLLILTGQRRGEIAALKRGWIGEHTITIPAAIAKNGRESTIPFGPLTNAVLETVPKTGDLVFPARSSTEKPFCGFGASKLMLDACGIDSFTLHDLRRTYSTYMAALGTPIHVLEKLLNHSAGAIRGVAAIYNRHSYFEEMKVAVALYEEKMQALFAR